MILYMYSSIYTHKYVHIVNIYPVNIYPVSSVVQARVQVSWFLNSVTHQFAPTVTYSFDTGTTHKQNQHRFFDPPGCTDEGLLTVLIYRLSFLTSGNLRNREMFFSPELLARRDSGFGLLWYIDRTPSPQPHENF